MVRPADASTCYPDAVAMVYDEKVQRVISVYSDRSLYVWDIRDLTKIGKYRSFIFHSDCVWGVEVSLYRYAVHCFALTTPALSHVQLWSAKTMPYR